VRKSSVFVYAIIAVALLVATGVFYSKYRKYEADYNRMTAQEEETRQRYSQAIQEIATISDSLNAIALGDEAKLLPASSQSEVQVPASMHDQALARIAVLKGSLERTKERIQDLDARLKKSNMRIAGMERMIAGLKRTVSEKETLIAQLDTQVDSLNTKVTGLSTEVAGLSTEVTEKERELATVFYTVGTKKELQNAGVVVSKGGVLGFGKTLKPSGTFNEAYFTSLDTDQETVIRIRGDKAQVLSPQPVSSYMLLPAGENAFELRILDPKEFRKVKHVVIMTTT
jgi:uncharacterized coiled-coil protein SlyX